MDGSSENSVPDPYRTAREEMVIHQIEARGVKNEKVLAAMRAVERHCFVPKKYRVHAYSDCPLPIGQEQTISQPYIVALMTEALALDRNMKVLEIGTGSGYQTAILATLCKTVFSIEKMESLGRRAEQTLAETGFLNVQIRIGDGYEGWDEQAPFDAVIVTCAPTHIPQPLIEQLKEGGRMVIPVGESPIQELVLLTKQNGKAIRKTIIPVRFVPMVNPAGKTY